MKKSYLLSIPVIILLIPVFLFGWLYSSKPILDGELKLPGLKEKVKVVRDKNGIPHIEAKTEVDALRALGYVMASDRLFQMDLLRRIGNGQLSEVLGEKTKDVDILLRTLRIRRTMDVFFNFNRNKIDPVILEKYHAFLGGVHHFMREGNLPPEFKILGYKPRPFTIQEAMSISGYLSLSFAEGIIADPLYSDLLSKFPKKQVDEIFIRHKNDINSITKKIKENNFTKSTWYNRVLKSIDFLEANLGLFHGSNSWVMSGKLSKSGSPLLANDPHVAFSNPGIWYEAHINTPEYEIYGHFIPLIPFAIMGHDKNRGWAVTMAETDDLDIYEEKVDPIKKRVMSNGIWVPLEEYEEVIKIKGEPEHRLIVSLTPHGPLIDKTKYGYETKHLSIKWSYHHPENDVITAFYKLSHSTKMSDLKDALKHGATPGLNVSWADKDGNIGWHVMSKIPIRPKNVSGAKVLEGWSGKEEYVRYFTIDENPHLYNPESGLIVTANYYPIYDGALPLEGYWQPSERVERIEFLLNMKEKWSLEELKAVQTDQFFVQAERMLPVLLKSVTPVGFNQQEAIRILKSWKGESGVDSKGSSIFHMWLFKTIEETLVDELGEKSFKSLSRVADSWHFFKTLLHQPKSIWWDDIRTKGKKETRDDILGRAFVSAIDLLQKKLGSSPSKWAWGNLHTIEFGHILGKAKPLNHIFNLGPYPAGGGFSQVDNMSSKRTDFGFSVTLGPSTRRLVDFKNPSESWGILPTGNSGHALSPYFDDQVEAFLNGKYRRQWMDMTKVMNHSNHVLNFIPGP